MNSYIIVFSTVPTEDVGIKIAHSLVKERLAACVNIVPGLTSVYEWKNEICSEKEFLLIIKSRDSLFDKIKDKIIDIHPYELPEVISLPLSHGFKKYLSWIDDNTMV